ncbi:MAG: hypothetical protein KC502_16525 [Myxococcales bacterium]|nr:hypothetical protein [Myxococcales bacterium]
MTPEQIVEVLESRGWNAGIVSRKEVDDLVEVDSAGLFKCVDGRCSDHAGMRGPKVLGGVYGIAATRGVTDVAGLQAIVGEVAKAGYVPSVHGDDHAAPGSMGCGFYKLWSKGELPGLTVPSYDSEAGKAAVLDVDGVYETLEGGHQEALVYINLVAKTTLEPHADQRFVVDAWITGEFNLDVPTYLTLAVETVERLNGPLVAQIIVD